MYLALGQPLTNAGAGDKPAACGETARSKRLDIITIESGVDS
jgi:hypothetical protein